VRALNRFCFRWFLMYAQGKNSSIESRKSKESQCRRNSVYGTVHRVKVSQQRHFHNYHLLPLVSDNILFRIWECRFWNEQCSKRRTLYRLSHMTSKNFHFRHHILGMCHGIWGTTLEWYSYNTQKDNYSSSITHINMLLNLPENNCLNIL